MRTTMTIAVAVVTWALCGCGDPPWDFNPDRGAGRRINTMLVNLPNDMAVRNAIIRQQTLYPYDFEENSAHLNELGQSDLAVLADHYRKSPGNLSVRRGDAPRELHDARVNEVIAALEKAGVTLARSAVTDTPAKGDGLPSETVLGILHPEQQQGRAQQWTAAPPETAAKSNGEPK